LEQRYNEEAKETRRDIGKLVWRICAGGEAKIFNSRMEVTGAGVQHSSY